MLVCLVADRLLEDLPHEGAAEEAADRHRHAGADHVRDDVVPDPLVRDPRPILVEVRNWTATAEGGGDLTART